jgi:hypothetical protein
MPPRKQPLASFEEQVSASFLEDMEKVAQRIAGQDGDPPGASRVGDAEAVRLWGQRDPLVDHDRLLTDLLTTGVPPETMQQLAIAKERPEWAALYTQPTQDTELARQLAVLAEHPFRAGLTLDYSAEPEEQVRRANHLDRLWTKQQAAQEAQLYGTPPPAQGDTADAES